MAGKNIVAKFDPMPSLPTWLYRRASWIALATAVAASEWLRDPGAVWVVLTAVLAVASGALVAGGRLRQWAIAAGTLGLTLTLAVSQARLTGVQNDWPGEQERRVTQAFRRLRGELGTTLRSTERLASAALEVADSDRDVAFAALDRALPRSGPEAAVAVIEPTGVPWAWAGRHRLIPELEGDSLGARFSRFFATLESRRHSPSGRVVVASVLIWADSAVPSPNRSLVWRFGASAGVQLRIFPPGSAPPGVETFDYTEPTSAGDRLLFSLQPVPPDQSVVQRDVLDQASERVGWGLLALLLIGVISAGSAGERLLLIAGAVWCTLRAPLGPAVGLDDFFSPAVFHVADLRPFANSPGALAVTSIAVLFFGIWLWRRRVARRAWTLAVATVLVLGTPYLVAALGRGILPPPSGVTTALWITWQVTLALATSALILLAAALLRSLEPEGGARAWRPAAGSAIALAAAFLGLAVWQPTGGWPGWYPVVWLPALVLVALPAPRWAVVVGTAIVAGTAAGVITWGAELSARVTLAQREIARLGEAPDDLASPYLQRFGDQVLAGPEPTAASAMYVLWRSSLLAGQEYPVTMGLWEPDGIRRAELVLDQLDLPVPLLAALVKGLDSTHTRAVVTLNRVPGRHYVLLQRLRSGRVLTCAVGPRTRLLPPARLARLLRAPAEGTPPFDLSLSPPFPVESPRPLLDTWWRAGNEVRTDHAISLPGGPRHVHAVIQIRPLSLIVVHGGLLLVVNFCLIGILWLLGTLRLSGLQPWLAVRRLARSFQVRLAVALALFFIIPAVSFTIWGLRRLTDEGNRTRDLLITSVLRDAALSAGGLLQEPADYLSEGLVELSNRLEADLVLYSGGRLVAASAPILEDLSLVEPLVDARVFQRLTRGEELELVRRATSYVAPVRVGYRVAGAGPPGGIGILATLQLAYDWGRSQDQRELAFLLLFATAGGLGAALLGAQVAARALSRPVADLRRSAAAVGQGQPLPPVHTPPAEFEQVFGAFTRMAGDIQASQAALDSARQRTAAVLANVATAVVALDANGDVILANARARQLLGTPLEEGRPFSASMDRAWEPVLQAVLDFRLGHDAATTVEVEVVARLVRLQLARLQGPPGGSVLALDDLTDVTHAARVLAWGEMARQVAHEIKNPLTPIRLGIQHLLRVGEERPDQLPAVLEETSGRILSEIDRLDTIARAFSRFGLPASGAVPLERVDLSAAAREVVALYRLTGDGTQFEVSGADLIQVQARLDEIKEALGNLLDNSRNAGARRVRIEVESGLLRVTDDGRGIDPDLLPHIFEPRFSTTTSGSGLGLPIVRRLVESWGGRVDVQSQLGSGTTVTIRWPQPVAPPEIRPHA
jgi:two-component system nitrogen regulation sensor histidine kinase NtrY